MLRRWLFLALLFAACASDDRTEVVVRIEAEQGVSTQIARLSLRVTSDPYGANLPVLVDPQAPWDGSYTIALSPGKGGPNGLYRIEVSAQKLGQLEPLAVARLISGYVRGETRYVRLLLEDSCVGRLSCSQNQSCHRGACVAADVTAEAFSRNATLPPHSFELSPASDAGIIPGPSGMSDAAVPMSIEAGPAVAAADASTPPVPGPADAAMPPRTDAMVPVTTPSDTPGQQLAAVEAKLRGCAIVGSGRTGLPPPADEEEACEYSCIVQADCSAVRSYVCDEDGLSPIDTCVRTCLQNTERFTCKSGERQPRSYVCDDEEDCSDGSDEDSALCATMRFTCKSGETQPLSFVCDQEPDCLDASDEAPALCSAEYFTCADGELVSDPGAACDDYPDCADRSDERGCATFSCPTSSG